MADFAPPSGPPPPKVPPGWKAIWNAEYKEWFYVNIHTKESTWEKPTEPAPGGQGDVPPSGPPPGYSAGGNAPAGAGTDVKKPLQGETGGAAASNNPYQTALDRDKHGPESDEAMAKRLQAEEDSRNRGPSAGNLDRGQAESYYNTAGQGQYGQNQGQYNNLNTQGGYPGGPSPGPYNQSSSNDRGSGGGLFGKLKNKLGGGSGSQQQGYGGGYPQQQYGGGYPQQGYGGYPQQGYGPPPGPYGGYGQQPMYAQQPQKRSGLGAGGAAALGLGGGLLGGALLMDAIDDRGDASYQQGYDQGYDQGDGGDFGGGDF